MIYRRKWSDLQEEVNLYLKTCGQIYMYLKINGRILQMKWLDLYHRKKLKLPEEIKNLL